MRRTMRNIKKNNNPLRQPIKARHSHHQRRCCLTMYVLSMLLLNTHNIMRLSDRVHCFLASHTITTKVRVFSFSLLLLRVLHAVSLRKKRANTLYIRYIT